MSNKDKIGRNDNCVCGSGKKYKRCCLDKLEGGNPPKGWGWSAVLILLGCIGGALLWNAKGLGAGLGVLGASLIFAAGVYILRDPAPPRKGGGDPSAINFGGKS